MGNETEIVDKLVDELNTGISADESSNDTRGAIGDGEQPESFSKDKNAEEPEDKLKGWSLHVERDDLYMWVHDLDTDIVVVESPEGYDWWNIYDSTDACVEGISCGPYDTLEAAIDQLDEDLSGR